MSQIICNKANTRKFCWLCDHRELHEYIPEYECTQEIECYDENSADDRFVKCIKPNEP